MINNKLSSTKIMLAIAILVTFGLVAYFIMPKNPSPIAIQPILSPTTTPVVTPTPEPASTPTSNIDISDWKTYRNNKYRFEIKYPKDWEYKIQEGGLGTDYGINFINSKNQDDFIFLNLGSPAYSAIEDPDQYAQKDFKVKDYKIESKETIIIDGINGVKYISSYDNPINKKYIAAYWRNDRIDSFYILETIIKPENINRESVINNIIYRMLSTLRFDKS